MLLKIENRSCPLHAQVLLGKVYHLKISFSIRGLGSKAWRDGRNSSYNYSASARLLGTVGHGDQHNSLVLVRLEFRHLVVPSDSALIVN
jgi:hypothetical protein